MRGNGGKAPRRRGEADFRRAWPKLGGRGPIHHSPSWRVTAGNRWAGMYTPRNQLTVDPNFTADLVRVFAFPATVSEAVPSFVTGANRRVSSSLNVRPNFDAQTPTAIAKKSRFFEAPGLRRY